MILKLLYEHRVLTTEHLTLLSFPSENAARHRLVLLHRLGVIDRFRPFCNDGRAPFHYTVGQIGALMLAAEKDKKPKDILRERNDVFAISESLQLAHLLGVNDFFVRLHGANNARASLLDWWSERACIAKWGPRIRPDGYGVLAVNGMKQPFFLEHDRSTESLHRVRTQLQAYKVFAFGTVLWWFLNPTRERNFVKTCHDIAVPFATADAKDGRPQQAIWARQGELGRRLPLSAIFTGAKAA